MYIQSEHFVYYPNKKNYIKKAGKVYYVGVLRGVRRRQVGEAGSLKVDKEMLVGAG